MAALVVVGGLLRLAVAWGVPSTPLGDELYYASTALHIARGDGHVSGPYRMKARWPPGESWWLSHFVSPAVLDARPQLLAELAETPPQEMDAAQRAFLRRATLSGVLVGTAAVALCGALAWLLFGPRVGLLAAALACVYPGFAAASATLWSENLFTALLTAALLAAVAWTRWPRAWLALLCGALFGLAGLTRELGLPMGVAAALWWVVAARAGGRRRASAHAVLLLLGAALVVLPWTLRNQREIGRFVPVSTVGWMGLREGNTLAQGWLERDWDAVREFRRRYMAIPDEVERMDMARGEALELIRDAQPTWLARKLVLNPSQLLSPDSELLTKIRRGAYGEVPDLPRRALLLATLAGWALLFTAAVVGIARAPDRPRLLLPLFAAAALLGVHVVANAFAKYRMPLEPLLMAYAAFALLGGGARRRVGRAGRAVAGVVLAVFAASFALFADDAARVWGASAPTPRASRPGRIVLLSMDTVRADAVASAELAPHIAKIAAEGVVFTDFYAASSYTIPTHMSMFTGLDPLEHGVTRAYARLSPAVPTLAERLRAAGFHTRGFHEGGFVEARFGFARGFEMYRRYPRVEVVRDALPSVLAWMREQGDEPYLLFLHTYAAHFPYGGFDRYRREHPERGLPSDETLREWRRRWPGRGPLPPREAAAIPPEVRELCTLYNHLAESHAQLLPCGGYVFGPDFEDSPHYEEDLAALRRSYAERVRLIDDAVGRLRALLEELGQWDDTLLIVTSDHGEAFFEHGLERHDYVPFDEVMKVPLVVSWPRRLAPRVVSGLAWQLDLLPTIAGLAGLDPPQRGGGLDLSAVLEGRASLPEGRVVFPVVLRPAHRKQEAPRRIALSDGRKRIEGHEEWGDAAGFLFDLESDPGETHDLRAEQSGEVAALDALIAGWRRGLSPVPPVHQNTGRELRGEAGEEALEIPADERDELRALGYAE
jgi:arylsulfatase A-like enzyme